MALGLQVFGTQEFTMQWLPTPCHYNPQNLKFQFTLFSGPTTQLSPLTAVAHGMFQRIHVSIGDIFGSHHSRLSFQSSGMWYTSMYPHPFQEKIQWLGPLSYLRRRSFQCFGVSGIRSPCIPHLKLLFAKILNYGLLFYLIWRSSPLLQSTV